MPCRIAEDRQQGGQLQPGPGSGSTSPPSPLLPSQPSSHDAFAAPGAHLAPGEAPAAGPGLAHLPLLEGVPREAVWELLRSCKTWCFCYRWVGGRLAARADGWRAGGGGGAWFAVV
jgi:hypothetical protein